MSASEKLSASIFKANELELIVDKINLGEMCIGVNRMTILMEKLDRISDLLNTELTRRAWEKKSEHE